MLTAGGRGFATKGPFPITALLFMEVIRILKLKCFCTAASGSRRAPWDRCLGLHLDLHLPVCQRHAHWLQLQWNMLRAHSSTPPGGGHAVFTCARLQLLDDIRLRRRTGATAPGLRPVYHIVLLQLNLELCCFVCLRCRW